jgi:hypothetical protein
MLNELENKIRKAIPELNELGVGCLISYDCQRLIIDDIFATNFGGGQIKLCFDDYERILLTDEYDIIGKPIQLNHVLEYVKEKTIRSQKIGILDSWNLKSNLLSEQSEELIKYINEL